MGAWLALSIVLALYSSRTIRVRFQFRDFYDYPANSRLPLFKQDIAEFGDQAGYIVAMVEAADVFRPESLECVRKLTAALQQDQAFIRVRSLANVQAIRAHGDEIASGPLISKVPLAAADREEIRQFVAQSQLLRRRLVSADARVTGILAEMRTPIAFSTVSQQRLAIGRVKQVLDRNPCSADITTRVTGSPVIDVRVTDALVQDQMVLMPAVVLVLALVLFLTFRSLHGILLCMSAVGVATIWTAGLFALLNRPVDIIGSTIPIAILVYGLLDPIFVLTRVRQKLELGRSKDAAIEEAFAELAMPCFLTSLTTAIGFAVFVGASAPTVRYFGITVAGGVLLAWLTSVTVLPLLLAFAPAPRPRPTSASTARMLDRAFAYTWRRVRGRSNLVIALTGILLVGGSWLARKQHLDNVYIDALPRGESRDDARALERALTGVIRLVVHLDGPPESMRRPRVLQAVERIERATRPDELVTYVSSLADLVAEANQAFQGGNQTERRVPESASLIAQYLALVDPGDTSDFVTDDYSKSHIDILLQDAGSEATRAVVARLQRTVDCAGFESLGVKAELTGNALVGYGALDNVVKQIIYGFATAFGGIVLLEWLVFRSLRIALISVVPNLVPVVACFFTLRVFHIQLKIESALVLCVSIGGLFNTTIHFVARTLQRRRETGEAPDALILHALRTIGPAALYTALTLSTGFAVLLLSTFPGLRVLGLLSMITLLTAFISDTIITPTLMHVAFDWSTPVSGGPPSASPSTVDAMLERKPSS